MIVTESNSNEQKTAKTSKGLLLISFNWQTQMSYKSESASISATFRIPNRSFLELTILRILKLQLLFPKGWRLSNIVIVSRKSTFCSEHDGTKNSTFNAYSKTRCALQEIYLLLCSLSVDLWIGQNMKYENSHLPMWNVFWTCQRRWSPENWMWGCRLPVPGQDVAETLRTSASTPPRRWPTSCRPGWSLARRIPPCLSLHVRVCRRWESSSRLHQTIVPLHC